MPLAAIALVAAAILAIVLLTIFLKAWINDALAALRRSSSAEYG